MGDEWGPWIEHDGMGCPVPLGTFVHAEHEGFRGSAFLQRWEVTKRAGSEGGLSWDWRNFPRWTRIIRYRVRKPRGMTTLNALLTKTKEKA